MIKAIPVMAVLAIAVAAPALAQQQYPSQSPSNESTTSQPPASRENMDEQARTPEAKPGEVETLRERGMSSPNVQGQKVPEDPATGIPEAQGRSDPKRLEGVPRP